jgi:hypothetical protein
MNISLLDLNASSTRRTLAERLVHIRTYLTKLGKIEKTLDGVKQEYDRTLLRLMEISGEKHFAFADLGTFTASNREYYSYDNEEGAESTGQEKMLSWLDGEYQAARLKLADILALRQDRLSTSAVRDFTDTYGAIPGIRLAATKTLSYRAN